MRGPRPAGVSPARARRPAARWSEVASVSMNTQEVGPAEIHKRSRVPHWDVAHGVQFVTFHLADAIPAIARRQIHDEAEAQRSLLRSSGRELTIAEKRGIDAFVRAKLRGSLAEGYGSCVLRDPRAAEVVSTAFEYFDGDRYRLLAWCVMPNHVHVVLTQRGGRIADIVHAWKSFTAKRLNILLGRNGPLWERDYWDRLIRNPRDLDQTVAYVMNNPSMAGLREWAFVRRYDDRLSSIL